MAEVVPDGRWDGLVAKVVGQRLQSVEGRSLDPVVLSVRIDEPLQHGFDGRDIERKRPHRGVGILVLPKLARSALLELLAFSIGKSCRLYTSDSAETLRV